jgi:hypothetical protein
MAVAQFSGRYGRPAAAGAAIAPAANAEAVCPFREHGACYAYLCRLDGKQPSIT